MDKEKEITQRVQRDIRFDKFLQIEGWACRGKVCVENRQNGKALEALKRINRDFRELCILMKFDPDGEL